MKRNLLKRIFVLVLCAGVILSVPFAASAQQSAPYVGYTYNAQGRSVPAPAGYMPDKVYLGKDMGATELNNPQDLFVYKQDGKEFLFVADTGENRILKLDKNFQLVKEYTEFIDPDGEVTELESPHGLFIRDDVMYICDTREKGDGRVIACDMDGNISITFDKPTGETIPKGFQFRPIKVVVDTSGYAYVVVQGYTGGLITFDTDTGHFITNFGANKVTVTAQLLARRFVRTLMSREATENDIRIVAYEIINVFMDGESFIYTVTEGQQGSDGKVANQVQHLNSLENNILRYNLEDANASGGKVYRKNRYADIETAYYRDKNIESVIADVNVDEDEIITVLDKERGRLFQYDQESNLMFVFGVRGDQKGTFIEPVSVERFYGQYVVLDCQKNSITSFKETYYAQKVREAVGLFNQGLYTEAEPIWREVLVIDSTNTMAYKGIGKALSSREEYRESLEYLKMGQDRRAYSLAYREFRKEFMGKNLQWVVLGVVIAMFAFVWIIKFIRKKLGFEVKKTSIRVN